MTGLLVLADGTVIEGQGFGAEGEAVGEVCFNTAMTGYQEILTDPSYAGQIVTFTFPHIGNVGTNEDDIETTNLAATSGVRGCIVKAAVTDPANYRSHRHFSQWLKARGIIGLSGIDTRALTNLIREKGMPNGVIAHHAKGQFDLEEAQGAGRRNGRASSAWTSPRMSRSPSAWSGTRRPGTGTRAMAGAIGAGHKVVAVDYGLKRNILRCLTAAGCEVTVVPATAERRRHTGDESGRHLPVERPRRSGGDRRICGAAKSRSSSPPASPSSASASATRCWRWRSAPRRSKMHQGHHGANHPVKDFTTGKVEITSMNHGFTVDRETLPKGVVETHVSLFDGSNCGIAARRQAGLLGAVSPEASPGPQDSHYLFKRFVEQMDKAKG